MGFPGSSAGKESACKAGDPGSIPGSRRSTGEGIGYPLQHSWASLLAQLVKKIRLQRRRPWVGKIPWRRERLFPPVSWSRKFYELYSPWGHKESGITERLSLLSETSLLTFVSLLFTHLSSPFLSALCIIISIALNTVCMFRH